MCRVSLQSRGFSLVELVVVMSIVAILSSVAGPALSDMWLDSRRTTAVNEFIHSVFLARSTAVMTGRTVTLCRSLDGRSCQHQTGGWQAGWIVFVDRSDDRPPERDRDETVLEVFQGWDSGSISSNRTFYSFRPNIHRVVNGSVVFCDRRGSARARAVIINSAGRPRVSAHDSNGRPLRCPSG